MQYYAVIKSDSLSHHGIKGQKWGVRRFQKADGSLTSAGQRRMDREYRHDAKTLAKLQRRADVGAQQQIAKKSANRSAAALVTATAALGASRHGLPAAFDKGARQISINANRRANERAATAQKVGGIFARENNAGKVFLQEAQAANEKTAKLAKVTKYASIGLAALGVGGAGYAAVNIGKSAVARYRMSEKGHAKAVNKAQNYEAQMREKYKGTKYGS